MRPSSRLRDAFQRSRSAGAALIAVVACDVDEVRVGASSRGSTTMFTEGRSRDAAPEHWKGRR
jgi:hypothetical protein